MIIRAAAIHSTALTRGKKYCPHHSSSTATIFGAGAAIVPARLPLWHARNIQAGPAIHAVEKSPPMGELKIARRTCSDRVRITQ